MNRAPRTSSSTASLYVSGSVFYVQWSNIQQAIYVPACGIQYTANAGNAVTPGL